jgi:hypothetical protein
LVSSSNSPPQATPAHGFIRFVIGRFTSSVTAPAFEVYADVDVLFVTPSAANPKVVDRKSWDSFRACGRATAGYVWRLWKKQSGGRIVFEQT